MNSESNLELDVLSAQGKKSGVREVPSAVFAAEPTPGLLHQVVRWQRAKKRAGTHAVKTRSEVRGGGAKPWKQKGTGRARAGSNSSPIWVGGGVAHGPKVRNYEFSINRKERKRAMCEALSARYSEGRVIVLQDFGLETCKTKAAVGVLNDLGVGPGSKALIVLGEGTDIATKSLRNIAGVRIVRPEGLNVYDILNAEYLIIAENTLSAILSRLGFEES